MGIGNWEWHGGFFEKIYRIDYNVQKNFWGLISLQKNILVDSHCHLNDEKFNADLDEVIARAVNNGVTRIINFGSTIEDSARVVELAAEYDELYAGVGVHPEEVFDMTKADLDRLASMTEHKKVVAIGEIGLDYYWEKDSDRRLLQQKIFIQQLDLARQLDLPVCIHEREAHGDALNILKREGRGLRGVMHCYSGSLEMARELWRMDWLIGVDGPLTFKNAAKLPEIVKAAPSDMLLIETDAPYMAPTPYRGKRNEPSYVKLIAEKLSEFRAEPLELIAQSTTANAERLYFNR